MNCIVCAVDSKGRITYLADRGAREVESFEDAAVFDGHTAQMHKELLGVRKAFRVERAKVHVIDVGAAFNA